MNQKLLTRPTDETPSLPTELDSAPSKLVYLYLQSAGACTIDDLQASLEMKKISLYPLLDSLASEGLVQAEGETYRPT